MSGQKKNRCCGPDCRCGTTRREFLKAAGAAAAAIQGVPLMAGPFGATDFEDLVPADKKLSPEWVRSLFDRGAPTVYRGGDLKWIGMPVGGIGSGMLYLGGDGKLWGWEIFNRIVGTGDRNYAHPVAPSSPLEQGFAVRISAGGKEEVRSCDRRGFGEISFLGQYPIGRVEYRDPALPVAVTLEAFSPFIPLAVDDSSFPATVLRFTVRNIGTSRIEAEVAGWLENAVCLHTAAAGAGCRRNRIIRQGGMTFIEGTAERLQGTGEPERPTIAIEDYEGGSWAPRWTVEGDAFGPRPVRAGEFFHHQPLAGWEGNRLADSFRNDGSPAATGTDSDRPKGKLTSAPFRIERRCINFLIGGGSHAGATCLNLVVDGKVVRTETGRDSELLEWRSFDVGELEGQTARIEVVDAHSGGWGHVCVDGIEMADRPRTTEPLEERFDFGAMGLGLLEAREGDRALAAVPAGDLPAAAFAKAPAGAEDDAVRPFGEKLLGALGRKFVLDPGEEGTAAFVVAWRFPNLQIDRLGRVGRHSATRFDSAAAVAGRLSADLRRLEATTRLWRDTWYDSTLPFWLLDRTLSNISVLATTTSYRFASGRFYGWEGVGCCAGTCGHVWQYAQAMARLFPELERIVREMVDFGIAFHPESGMIEFRGEHGNGYAADAQLGYVLRAYREHRMSAGDGFLRRVWPRARKALEYLIAQDGDGDGIIENGQHNTLDVNLYGPSSWLTSLYLAALRAGEEMAGEMGDGEFAGKVRTIADAGRKRIVEVLWNGEYFIHKPDPRFKDGLVYGNGCEIDQVMGQGWAFQAGLRDRVIDADHARKALEAVWRYNFTPDVGPYRKVHPEGRWYAMPGEGGLLICTFPKGDRKEILGEKPVWAAMYFNECQSGYEYEAAGHMVAEGLVMEGLAVTRAIHDRYHASRRNPWNEVECGDHYARSMASYGVFINACGWEYHGPKGYVAFAPRIRPEDFRAAFTAAEGWGSIAQRREPGRQVKRIEVKWGRLRARTLAFRLPEGERPAAGGVEVLRDGAAIPASFREEDGRVVVELGDALVVEAGSALEVRIRREARA